MNNLHTPQRLTGESFDDYKARRKASKEAGRMVRLVWDTKNQGIFINHQKRMERASNAG